MSADRLAHALEFGTGISTGHRDGVRRQSIGTQVMRTKAESVEVVKVRTGSGV